MKTYVTTTGAIFGLLALVHVWRAVVEGPHLATDPWYVLITLVAAVVTVVGLVAPLLSIHGWVFFLTYPANAPREAWLERHRVIPRLYVAGFTLAVQVEPRVIGRCPQP